MKCGGFGFHAIPSGTKTTIGLGLGPSCLLAGRVRTAARAELAGPAEAATRGPGPGLVPA